MYLYFKASNCPEIVADLNIQALGERATDDKHNQIARKRRWFQVEIIMDI